MEKSMNTLKNQANRTRKIQVKVMLNETEYKHFIKQVDKTPYTKSEYLRSIIGGKEIHTRQPEEYFEVRRLVSNMSNNINQIARISNTYGNVDQGHVQVLLQMMHKCWIHIRDL